MRALLVAVMTFAGCTFGVDGLPLENDPGADAGDDASVALDGSGGVDLRRMAPDGVAPGAIGWPCGAASECSTGFCIDGYCCDSACDPTDPGSFCKACNVPGLEGQCSFAADGTDPHQQCTQADPSTCGQDGLCDGNGKCRLYEAGTVCKQPTCANGTTTYAAACDGNGNCTPPGPPASCYPYSCANANSCNTSCTSDAQCATGIVCNNGTCGKRADGQPCTADTNCQSGTCAQGVCCASACDGTCFSCNLPGSVGSCAAVPAGQDPLNQCAATAKSTCGQDGTCDGSGACRLWAMGTVCAAASCMGDSRVSPSSCDGNGTCVPGMAKSCGNYTCNPATATCDNQPCTSNAQCAVGKTCNTKSGKCM